MPWLKSLAVFFLILAVVLYYKIVKVEWSPIVELQNGSKFQGVVTKSREGKGFYGYYGIPFAEPPIGKLRFQSPKKIKPWEGVWDASYHRPLCSQFDFMLTGTKMMSQEDCLYLNVYAPTEIPEGKKFPVLFYIHGGYFHMGGMYVAGPEYFMDHDVIVVAVSYRLGALGFLSSGDATIRGNFGLKDQLLGLQWVQENIETFGGDKTKVTIFGESAGGASAHYQNLSPKSKSLFWRVIRQSGSALNYWTIFRDGKKKSDHFAKQLGCPSENSQELLECLQDKDVDEILDVHREMLDSPYPFIGKFCPTIETVNDEDAFLTEEPEALMKSGRFNKVPVLSGFSTHEGVLHSAPLWANTTKLDQVQDWETWAPKAFHYANDPSKTKVSKKIRDFYFGDAKTLNSLDAIDNLTSIFTDRLFSVGITESALLERRHVPKGGYYMYYYDHEGGFNMGTLITFSQGKIHPVVSLITERLEYLYTTYIKGEKYYHPLPGTGHADEHPLLWYGLVPQLYLTQRDREMSKDLVKLWVDFARGEDELTFRGAKISPVSVEGDLDFFHLNMDDPKMIKEPNRERRLFWETLPKLTSE